ncbi:UDP-glucose 4-epimerase GalE [Microcella sp.]|uniref:UDP-glucose 4-epimerase GalE n=1 Tax=Microcella sp. TaxID=1913979 RepID=UPI002560E834|nr:UDP-glucose 4-epimerase GalE [Microcella sp.]MBX9472737.1 UDP-glucose 4-epimerase GalE [Microcella sp.]
MRVLVTGGSGYIGSHICRLLVERGDMAVIVDDFVNGVRARVAGMPAHELDLAEHGATLALARVMRDEGVDAVIHLAARKQVGESVARPLWYHQQNGGSLTAVLEAMLATGVRDLVFSSSAAVYGDADGVVTEDSPTVPVNPYGETKLAGEWLAADVARAEGLRVTSLRYFNVAGAGWPDLADTAVLNLVPMALAQLDAGRGPQIFGDDYATPDGTGVRDFVHVRDLAEAHLAVLDALPRQLEPHRVYNVGTGVGSSVREVVEGIRSRLTDAPAAVPRPRRPGDPAAVVADVSRIADELGWRAQHDLDDIIDSVIAARA